MSPAPLCALDELPREGARELCLPGDPPRFLILVRRGDRVWAWRNVCPHAGRPLSWAPDRFLFTPEDRLVCAAHGACFDPRTGLCVAGPCAGRSLEAHPVEVREGSVYSA